MRDIHESDACTSREVERRNPGTFNVDCEVHEWRAVSLLVSGDANSGNAILRETLISETVKLALSGNARQFGFDLRQIEIEQDEVRVRYVLESPLPAQES